MIEINYVNRYDIKFKGCDNVRIIQVPIASGYIAGIYTMAIPTYSYKVRGLSDLEDIVFKNPNKLIHIYPDFENNTIFHSGPTVYNPNTFESTPTYFLRYCFSDYILDNNITSKDDTKEKRSFKYLLIKS
jgi:hypothetical protein